MNCFPVDEDVVLPRHREVSRVRAELDVGDAPVGAERVEDGPADEADEVDLALGVGRQQEHAVGREGERGEVGARLDGEGERGVRLEVVDGELVADRGEDCGAVGGEDEVAAAVDGAEEVGKAVVELHPDHLSRVRAARVCLRPSKEVV